MPIFAEDFAMRQIYPKILYVAVALVFVSLAYCLFAYPLALDDYWFLTDFKKGVVNAGDNYFWEGLKNFWSQRINYDNGRFGNMLGITFLLLPRWITAAISCIALFVIYILMCTLAGIRRHDYVLAALMAAFVAVGLPWHDSIFSSVYMFNYLWDSPMMLYCMYLALRKRSSNVALCFISGVILGGWHENYSVPVLVATLSIMVFGFEKFRKDRLSLCVGLALGLAWLMLLPCWSSRVKADMYYSFTLYTAFQLLYHIIGWIPFMLLWLMAFAVKKWRKVALSPTAVYIVVATCSIIIVQCMVLKARAGFPAFILSYVGIVYMIRNMVPALIEKFRKWLEPAMCMVMIAVVAHLALAAFYVTRLRNEIETIHEVYVNHKERPVTIFADITYDWQQSPLALKKGFFEKHAFGWHFMKFHEWSGAPLHNIVPMDFKSYKFGMGDIIPGTAGAYIWNGYIVMPFKKKVATVWISYGGDFRNSDLSVFRGADGKYYYFVDPYTRTWEFGLPVVKADICISKS